MLAHAFAWSKTIENTKKLVKKFVFDHANICASMRLLVEIHNNHKSVNKIIHIYLKRKESPFNVLLSERGLIKKSPPCLLSLSMKKVNVKNKMK